MNLSGKFRLTGVLCILAWVAVAATISLLIVQPAQKNQRVMQALVEDLRLYSEVGDTLTGLTAQLVGINLQSAGAEQNLLLNDVSTNLAQLNVQIEALQERGTDTEFAAQLFQINSDLRQIVEAQPPLSPPPGLSEAVTESTKRAHELYQRLLEQIDDTLPHAQPPYFTIFAIFSVTGLALLLTNAIVISRYLTHRLYLIAAEANTVEKGDLAPRAPPTGSDEIAQIGRSIGRLRMLSAQHKTTQIELQLARQSAERLASAKSDFLALMSHEVRTPLNAITGIFELIARSEIPDRQKQRAEKGKDAAAHLLRLLSKILDASRLDANGMVVVPEHTSVKELASFAEETLAAIHATTNKKLETKVTLNATRTNFATDPILAKQIVTNIIDNAFRFTETGAIKVRIDEAYDQNGIEITISDTGVGIAKEDIARIYEPYQQLDGIIRRRSGGSGLGMSISQNLAKLMGGDLSCVSTLGKGTTFTLRLPSLKVQGDNNA